MNFAKIVELQKTLDNHIHQLHKETYESTFTKRKLALIVEVSELANEVRCFKYWSLKAPSEKAVILEEFVDCLHFTVSLGIGMEIDFDQLEIDYVDCADLSLSFVNVISSIIDLDNNDVNSYSKMFNTIMNLAKSLGFESNEIFDSYVEKNTENHKRQKNNY